MKKTPETFFNQKRWLALSIMMTCAFLLMSLLVGSENVSANHPVLVEGNCDSPTPFTNVVAFGTCGDYDGDGRIGTAEDTDGADRIFGTIAAALGPGTGAAAGTGGNQNAMLLIVASGRFAEALNIAPGGNVTIAAAPGVKANINAVLDGDTEAANNARQEAFGISVSSGDPNRKIILRNLTISNWARGVSITGNARVTIDNCRFENNRDAGIAVQESSRASVFNSRITASGFRISTANNATVFGIGIVFTGTASGEIFRTQITSNRSSAISNQSAGTVNYYEVFFGDNGTPELFGNVTRLSAP